jgi:hypothetical protein
MQKNEQIEEAIRIIWDQYEPLLTRPSKTNPQRYIAAESMFELLGGVCSRPTMYRAKGILGIKSGRVAGKWVWFLPKRTADKACQKLHQITLDSIGEAAHESIVRINELARPTVLEMADSMEAAHFDCLARDIVNHFKACGYTHKTAHRAKKILGIVSVKRSDGWHWVLPHESVQKWLEERLSKGPVLFTQLLSEARRKQWTEDLLRVARARLGGIKGCWIEHKHHWYDMNTFTPELLDHPLHHKAEVDVGDEKEPS